MAHIVICPQKKTISRIFKICGTLIVKSKAVENNKMQKQILKVD
jgi:hypothetical protein